jgi:nitrate/TMAO reductase-like tetraheme cytochrome c subunit
MNPETSNEQSAQTERPSLLRNWISLSGLVIITGSLFSTLLLFIMDAMSHGSNAYIGILTYFIAPAFFLLGVFLTVFGALKERYNLRKLGATPGGVLPRVVVDLSRPRDRKRMAIFLVCAVSFLLISAVGSYHTYHFTESTTFCGKSCHQVMEPEYTAYQNGPHARVSCGECHIGSGATWYVKSKLSGMYQVYSVFAKKYSRPIPTPIHNLRPAQETCEQCHWPKKFVGNMDRTFNYYLDDKANTPFSVRMLIKVGGSDPTHGPVGGIHWHMNVGNKIEYIATDEARQVIPWVRSTDANGVVREFRAPKFTGDPSKYNIRRMDCMDCHNRPAHSYQSPSTAVNLAISTGKIDSSIPSIKGNAVKVLTKTYQHEEEALQNISSELLKTAPNHPHIRDAIATVQDIYKDNFFPEMNVSWKAYPNNLGHMEWPGCFRCHDNQHLTADGKDTIKASDCATCHIIVAQGSGKELETLSATGFKFAHPGGDLGPADKCSDCHGADM